MAEYRVTHLKKFFRTTADDYDDFQGVDAVRCLITTGKIKSNICN